MHTLHPIPPPIARRWALARSGFRYDVAGACWRNGADVRLSDEAIDDPDEARWALLMGRWDPSAPSGGAMHRPRDTWRRPMAGDEPHGAAVTEAHRRHQGH
jgi:hypothetical protein